MISRTPKKGPSEDEFATLDLGTLRFPSDGLSIKVLRQEHHPLFDKGFFQGRNAQPQFFFHGDSSGHAVDVLANMLFCERFIAVCAYADARGLERPDGDVEEFKDEVTSLYLRYGLASGKHHAVQLLRMIEQQGAALARDKGV